MLKHIQIVPLIIGIIVGIVGIYFVAPDKNIIYKYPVPENVDKITYKDKNGICYKYQTKKVDCDKNESKLKAFPLSS